MKEVQNGREKILCLGMDIRNCWIGCYNSLSSTFGKLIFLFIFIDILLSTIGLMTGRYGEYNLITRFLFLNYTLFSFLLVRIIQLIITLLIYNNLNKLFQKIVLISIIIIYSLTIMFDLYSLNIIPFNILIVIFYLIQSIAPNSFIDFINYWYN